MRGWMSSAKSYLPPVKIGSVMRASVIAKVVATESGVLEKEFPIGSIVKTEIVGVQTYCLLKNCTVQKARKLLTRLDQYPLSMPLSLPLPLNIETTTSNNNLSYASFLGVLGTTGLTAYFGLLKVGMPKKSDTVLVSGAAGATGSIVAQIAKHVVGCKRVIGTAGTDAKCQWLEDNGIVDVAINYKTVPNLAKAIYDKARSSGNDNDNGNGNDNNNNKSDKSGNIDLVFDNVGSTFLEAALSNLAMSSKIVLCGAISQYNVSSGGKDNNNDNNNDNGSSDVASGPRNYMNLLVKRATMTGFVVLDYKNEFPTAISDLVQWIKEGKIQHYKEDTTHSGISNFYPALLSLFQGTNVGKVVLQVGTIGHQSKL